MSTDKVQKSSSKFYCAACDYSTIRKSQYNRHLTTRKHMLSTNNNISDTNSSDAKHVCECGKVYKERSGLYKHKKKCKSTSDEAVCETVAETDSADSADATDVAEITETTIDTKMKTLIEENRKLKTILMGMKNNLEPVTNETNHINCNNKVYNINIQINKDANNGNIFIESIQMDVEDDVDISDIEHTLTIHDQEDIDESDDDD